MTFQTFISPKLGRFTLLICLVISHFSLSGQWSYMDFLQYPALNKNITGMHFFDGNHGVLSANNFSSTANGELMWTSDGGQSWATDTNFPSTFSHTRSLFFLTDSIGIVSADGNILRTSNYGQSWSTVLTAGGNLIMDFPSSSTGYAVKKQNGELYKTTDSGQSWTQGANAFPFYSFNFVDSLTGILATYPAGGTSTNPSILYRTSNGGVTWDSLFTLSDTTSWGYPYFFLNPQMDCLGDTCLVVDGWSNLHARTFDGGIGWTIWQDTTQILPKDYVRFRSDGMAFAGSNFMSVVSSTNYGTSWDFEFSSSASPATVMNFAFRDSTCTFAFGDFGTLESGCFPATARDVALDNRTESLSLYPNPANETIGIELHAEIGYETKLEVYNQFGQMIEQVYAGFLTSSEKRFKLNTENYPNGVYRMRLRSGGNDLFQTFVVAH